MQLNKNYLSLENANCLKGIFAILVVIHHLCAFTGLGADYGLGPIYTALGFWSVSIFMFLSGYGLMYCLSANYAGYLQGFLRKRILPVYSLMALLTVTYYTLKCILLGDKLNFYDLLQSFLFGDTVITNGWYLQSIIIIYILFYISARISLYFNNEWEGRLCLLMFVALLVYIALCLLMHLGSTWYETVFSFELGMLFSLMKGKFDATISTISRNLFLFFLIVPLFLLFFALGCGPYLGEFAIPFKMLCSCFFVLTVIILIRVINISNYLTRLSGKIYLEIYILQGIAVLLLQNRYFEINNKNLFFVLAFLITIVLAYLFSTPIKNFMEIIKYIRVSAK